jgi:hypothetical protein
LSSRPVHVVTLASRTMFWALVGLAAPREPNSRFGASALIMRNLFRVCLRRPASSADRWHTQTFPMLSGVDMTRTRWFVSARAPDFCTVADLDGNVRVGDPDHLGPPRRLGAPAKPLVLGCPSEWVCIAAGPNGAITGLTSGRWYPVTSAQTTSPLSTGTEAVSCAADSSDFCGIADGFGDVPLGGAPFA